MNARNFAMAQNMRNGMVPNNMNMEKMAKSM